MNNQVSIGSYQGKPIYAGTDANISQQMFGTTPKVQTPTVPGQMSVKDIQTNSPLQGTLTPTSQLVSPVNTSIAVATQNAYNTNLQNLAKQEEQAVKVQENNVNQGTTELYKMMGLQSDYEKEFEAGKQQLLQQKQQAASKTAELSAQLNAYTSDTESQKANSQNSVELFGGTTGGVQASQEQIQRQRAGRSLQMSAALAGAQGQQALAQDAINDYIQYKYDPYEKKIANLKTYLDINKDELSRRDKKAYDAQQNVFEMQKYALDNGKATDEKIQNVMTAIAPYAPNDVIQKVSQATSVAEAIRLAGQYISPDKAFELKEKMTEFNSKYNIPDATNTPLGDFKNAIAAVESSNNYNATGPVIPSGPYKGDRAYGKYQVMGLNVPSWTQEAGLGRMTPEQFKNNPQAQEQVADYMFNKNYQQYGNWDDVASIWFSGRPMAGNISADVTGTSVPDYINKYRKNLTGGDSGTEKRLNLDKTQMSQYNDIVNEVNSQIKNDLETVKFANSIVNTGAQAKAGNRQAQVALIFNFMKALDPTSTVRETEFSLAQNAQSAPENFRQAIQKFTSGEKLSNESIDEMLAVAQDKANSARLNVDMSLQDAEYRGSQFRIPKGTISSLYKNRMGTTSTTNTPKGTDATLSEYGL